MATINFRESLLICQVPAQWRSLLFETVQYRTGLSDLEYQHYRDVNYYVGKFCCYLESGNYLKDDIEQEMLRELRRYYRLNLGANLRRINYLY